MFEKLKQSLQARIDFLADKKQKEIAKIFDETICPVHGTKATKIRSGKEGISFDSCCERLSQDIHAAFGPKQ
jgi:hypothetical protein